MFGGSFMKTLSLLLAALVSATAAPALAAVVCQGNCSTAAPNLNVGNSGGGQGSLRRRGQPVGQQP